MAHDLQSQSNQQVQQARVPEILRAWTEIDRVFDQLTTGFGLPSLRQIAGLSGRQQQRQNETIPSLDATENQNEYRISVELPGVDQRDIDVNIEGNLLSIRGERRQEWQQDQSSQTNQTSQTKGQNNQNGQQSQQNQGNYLIAERSYGQIQRTLQLTADIDRDNIKAEYRNGVLALTLPKSQQARAQRRQIEVQAQS